MALLIAIVLLSLCAALVVGATSAANALARSERSTEAAIRVAYAAERGIAETISGWGAEGSLPVGATSEWLTSTDGIRLRIRVERLSERRFLVASSASAGNDSVRVATRNVTILLETPLQVDSLGQSIRPIPVARWALADIY